MLDRLRARAQRSDEGFTLIELLIVIVILGILAAIVVFAVGTQRSDATKAACQADLATVQVADEAYKAKNGSYAADAATLQSAGLIKSTPTESFTYDTTNGVSGTCPPPSS